MGGTPYNIQNILPVLFNMKVKNYILGTFFGSMPAMFITVSLGSGIEQVIEKNREIRFFCSYIITRNLFTYFRIFNYIADSIHS